MKCAWCDNEAVGKPVEVQPVRYRTVTATDPVSGEKIKAQECAQQAIVVYACQKHRTVAQRNDPSVDSLRRKKAKGVQQTTIFDALGQSEPDARESRPTMYDPRAA